MPTYTRWRDPGAWYFFTVVTAGRAPLFRVELARKMLSDSMKQTFAEMPVDLWAIVLLPDHLHCIWGLPKNDDRFPARWAKIKRGFTQRWLAAGGDSRPVSAARHAKHGRGVWQERFWEHQIRDEQELFAYRDYIHLNPVKHGYVRDPLTWRWSSVHRHLPEGSVAPGWESWSTTQVRYDP